MIITLEQLNSAFADATEEDVELYFESFNQVCEDYEINTPQRISAFIAQVAHESGQLSAVKENLNYSADGLMRIFKKYFTPSLAAQYARKPEKIASRVYANRMGNGPESSGEGWKFRGRGLIQLTGKDNYTRFAEDMEMTLDEVIEYLETPEGAMESAAWFWDSRNLNSVADRGDITRVSQLVNGKPVNHLQDRIDLYNHALSVLA